jgi:A/G-specific adenine glycosylase
LAGLARVPTPALARLTYAGRAMDHAERLHDRALAWYAEHARDLPWRRDDVTPWGVFVSEVMLQQTPVSRVLPVWTQWLRDYPRPADLAAAPSGEAVRAWGKLGYPRRALRLHAAATEMVGKFEGEVPASYDDLRTLPGVGDYTAAAVAAFAHRRRQVVLDTNVRRVLARVLTGTELPPISITRPERVLAESVLPDDAHASTTWSVAVMELGALLCRPANPRCPACPLRDDCAWRAAGHPPDEGPPRPVQAFVGTDRQCRGRLLDVLRDRHGPVTREQLDRAWADDEQRARCLASLLDDGLVTGRPDGTYALPG